MSPGTSGICKHCGNHIACLEKGGLDWMRCTGCGDNWYAPVEGEAAA